MWEGGNLLLYSLLVSMCFSSELTQVTLFSSFANKLKDFVYLISFLMYGEGDSLFPYKSSYFKSSSRLYESNSGSRGGMEGGITNILITYLMLTTEQDPLFT